MACLALAATIFLLIFIGLVFNGVLNGIVRDLGDMRFGDVQITNKVGSLDIEDEQIIRGLLVNEHIISATPRFTSAASMNSTTSTGQYQKYNIETVGMEPIYENMANSKVLDTITEGEFYLSKNTIILGKTVAEDLNVRVGDFVRIKVFSNDGIAKIKTFRISGISAFEGSAGFDFGAIININELRELRGVEKEFSTAIMVHIDDGENTEEVIKWIQSKFPNFKVQSLYDATEPVRAGIGSGIAFINIVGYIGMVAAAFGVVTILTMMVTSKIRDIGILRAIGLQKKHIIFIFIIDGAIIGILGSLLGGLISGLAGLYMSLNQVAFAGGLILEITFDANTLLSPLLIGFMLSILASIYPAWKASRYHPTEAMRYV